MTALWSRADLRQVTGTLRWVSGTPLRWITGTPLRWITGTPVRRVTGTPVRRTRTTAPFPSKVKPRVAVVVGSTLAPVNSKLSKCQIQFPMSPCLQAGLCTVPPKPVIPSKKPFKVDLVGGKRYSWCTCGHSNKQPFCDGAHKLKAKSFSPLRFVPEKDTTAWLCGCKYTSKPPYCDGTHKQHSIVSAALHEGSER